MNRSRLTVIAALVAVLAIAAGVVVFTMGGSDDSTSRQRNAALDSKLDTSFGTGGYMLLSFPDRPFTVVDSVTTPDGTTYMVGTIVINGLRHAVIQSTKNGLRIALNLVLPLNNSGLERGTWTQPIKETVPIALSVDNRGSVWVLADGYHSTDNRKTPFVTQLKSSGLGYYPDCGTVCGTVFASWTTVTDIAVNPAGDRLIVVGPDDSMGFKPSAGKDIEMGYGFTRATPDLACPQFMAATHVTAMEDRFYLVNDRSTPKTAVRVSFGDYPTALECTNKLPLVTVSDITTDFDGTLYAYGKSTATTVGFWRMQAGAMSSGSGMGSLSPRMPDVPTTNVFPGGITASSGTLHMAASVNSLNGPKTIIEYVVRNNSSNISTAIDEVSSEVTATTPPLLTRHGQILTLIAPTSDTGTAASLVARFNAGETLVGAPEWFLTTQTINLEYGSTRGMNFSKPSPSGAFSLDSGDLPPGMSVHPTFGLRGAPQGVGTFTAKIKATNSGGSSSSTLTFNVAAVAPTEGAIRGWKQVDGNVIIEYLPGQFGSDKDVITAGATDPSGLTVIGECQGGQCVFPEGNLEEGTVHEVRLTHRNDVGEALSVNSIFVTPLGMAQKVTDVNVAPGLREATVSFTEPANTEDLAVSRFDIAITDKETGTVVSAISCGSSPCDIDIDAPNSERKYVASVTAVYNEVYSMSPATSSEFSVSTPTSIVKFEFNENATYKVAARQFFVIPLMAQGADSVNLFASPEVGDVRFKSNPARLEGVLNPGIYEIPVDAYSQEGTVTSFVTIEVAPGTLPAPELSMDFNTYDGKLAVVGSMPGIVSEAVSVLKWKAQINNTVLNGECVPNRLCALDGIPFDSEVSFRIQAVSDIEEPSEWVEMTVFTPSREKPVAIDTASFRLMPSDPEVGIVEFSVRTALARKFSFELQADATVQVDAMTSCEMNFITDSSTYRGAAIDSCPVDPYARLFSGDTMVWNDDDSGAFDLYDPATLEDDEPVAYGVSNQFSSRMSVAATPGAYTLEVAHFADVMDTNAGRGQDKGEVDIYLVIITTPAEAARLVETSISAQSTTVTRQGPIGLEVNPADVMMVPPTLAPAETKALEDPKTNAVANKSGANITGISVTAGNKALTLTPSVITSKPDVPQVKITLTPGNKSCTVAAGKACTIKGLSPWLSYSATAIVPGDASGASTSGLRPGLELKAGSKVSVSSLGLAAAAKSVKASVTKKSLRASGSCSLNAAQTVLTVGKTGSCSVSVRTTKTVKKKAVAGPSLSLRAVIK